MDARVVLQVFLVVDECLNGNLLPQNIRIVAGVVKYVRAVARQHRMVRIMEDVAKVEILVLIYYVTTSLEGAREIRLIVDAPLLEVSLQVREGGFAILTVVAKLHLETQICYGSFAFRRVNDILCLVHDDLLELI